MLEAGEASGSTGRVPGLGAVSAVTRKRTGFLLHVQMKRRVQGHFLWCTKGYRAGDHPLHGTNPRGPEDWPWWCRRAVLLVACAKDHWHRFSVPWRTPGESSDEHGELGDDRFQPLQGLSV